MAWEVRFSEWLNGKRFQRTMTFQGTEYPKEADVRKAIELTVSHINSGTAGEKADAQFSAIITLYRRKFLPSESRLLELKKKLHKVFPADGAMVDAFISAFEHNPMQLIEVKGVSKRQKEIQQITVEQFKSIRADLPEVLNVLVLADASLALRISELLALQWEDLDVASKTIFIRRKFTRGRTGKTKTPASNAMLPVADTQRKGQM